jgi:hypothetical protein
MVPGDFAAGKKADQRHISQRPPHNLQLGTGRAKVRAAATLLGMGRTTLYRKLVQTGQQHENQFQASNRPLAQVQRAQVAMDLIVICGIKLWLNLARKTQESKTAQHS